MIGAPSPNGFILVGTDGEPLKSASQIEVDGRAVGDSGPGEVMDGIVTLLDAEWLPALSIEWPTRKLPIPRLLIAITAYGKGMANDGYSVEEAGEMMRTVPLLVNR
jgi:hypothetical protein